MELGGTSDPAKILESNIKGPSSKSGDRRTARLPDAASGKACPGKILIWKSASITPFGAGVDPASPCPDAS